MTCREFLDAVEDLGLGYADAARAEAIREHAAACPACAARRAETEALDTRLKGLRENFTPSPGLPERIRSAVLSTGPAAAPERPTPPYIRLWRWAPVAAGLLFIVFFATLFLAGPGPAVPPLIADTITAYEDLAAGTHPAGIDPDDPKAIRDYFEKRLSQNRPVRAPSCGCTTDSRSTCRCATILKSGCQCAHASASGGAGESCVVRTHGETLLAAVVINGNHLTGDALETGIKRIVNGRPVYMFEKGGVRVAACPCGDAVHLVVARVPDKVLIDALQTDVWRK